MNMVQLRNTLLLLITAAIWGFGFVAQSVGAEYVGPFTFLATRSWLAWATLLPVLYFFGRRHGSTEHSGIKPLLVGGSACGFFLFAASAAQQAGIELTTTAKAGFITALYILVVPFISLFMGKRVGIKIWLCAAVGVIGLYLLCITDGLALEKGDALVLLCAFLYAGHILTIDRFSPRLNGVALSCVQFFVTALLATVCMFIFENPQWSTIVAAGGSIVFAGVISSGVGYTLQIIGQQDLNPTVASLAMSLESVFSALAGWMILGQGLTLREMAGCGLMFAAIVAAQLPDRYLWGKK